MNPLYRQAITQSVFGLAFFIALVFLSAGTWHYWQGWTFLAVFAASTTGFTIYLAIYDQPLLARRMKTGPQHEQERSQRVIVSLIIVAFFAFIVLSILDWRIGLSPVPAWVSLLGDALVVAAFVGIFWVISVNSWAASNVRVEADQKVIDTGPYAFVRHPMYAAAFWLFVGIPLALGSWYTTVLLIPFLAVLLWRLTDEERILVRDLPGYAEYRRRVKHRLVPGVW
jgi:protein-S-isoprenylcysteine O-methyltransferase Ste14